MDKITTPMAILTSGILIALVITFKNNTPKYSFVNHDRFGHYMRLDNQTGEVCAGTTSTLGGGSNEFANQKNCK